MNSDFTKQEIDLRELTVKTYFFLKRKYWLIFLLVAIGASIGYIKTTQIRKYYEIQLLANSTVVPNDIVIGMVNTLQFYISKREINDLSNALSISPKNIENIKIIKGEKILRDNAKDSLNKYQNGYFLINLEIYDSTILDSLKTGILNYIKNQKLISENAFLLKEQQQKLLTVITEKIKEIEKNNIENKHNATIARDVILYYENKFAIEKEKKLFKEAEYIEDYARISTIDPPKTRYILMYSFLFFILGAILSFAIEFFRKAKHFLISSRTSR